VGEDSNKEIGDGVIGMVKMREKQELVHGI
jgi:hypothetical protein